LNGWLAAKYGYRKVIIVALFFLNAFIFITFLAPNKPVLVVGQIRFRDRSFATPWLPDILRQLVL
jgi:MFS family permease